MQYIKITAVAWAWFERLIRLFGTGGPFVFPNRTVNMFTGGGRYRGFCPSDTTNRKTENTAYFPRTAATVSAPVRSPPLA